MDRALASTVFSMVYGKHTSEWGKHSRTQGFFPKVPSPWRLWCRDLATDLTQSSALGVRMFPPLVTNFFFFKLFCGSFLSTAANQDNNFSSYRIFNNWIFLEKEFICSVPWVFFFFFLFTLRQEESNIWSGMRHSFQQLIGWGMGIRGGTGNVSKLQVEWKSRLPRIEY